jgi:hypothetical protein
MWHGNEHMNGPLYEKFGPRIIYDFVSYFSAKLSSVIRNGDWCWPAARSVTLVKIQAGLSGMELGSNDKVIWLPTADHNFKCASAWDQIRRKLPEVEWWSIIWFSKHTFKFWLATRNRLSARDRLVN